MDDPETLHRRARLRELIERCFSARLIDLIAHIEAKTGKRPNQGELSALQKDHGPKSFGDKKAKTLAEQIGLHRHWFAMPNGSNLQRSEWMTPPSTLTSSGDVNELSALIERLTSSGKMHPTELQNLIAMLKAREGNDKP